MNKKLVFNKAQTQERDLRKIFYLYSIVKKEYQETAENINKYEYTVLRNLENKIWSNFEKVLFGKKFVTINLTDEETNLLPDLLSKELENIKQTPIGFC